MGTQSREDRHVIATMRSDFDAGFTELVRMYQPTVYAGARRMTPGREAAQDVAQDTFVRAYRALRGFDGERMDAMRFRPWLWTIALNVCRSRARRPGRELELTDPEAVAVDDDEAIDEVMWRSLLSKLSVPQRNAVVLRHVLDLPIAEIAEITGRPAGTVKADISRGLTRLRGLMNEEEHQ
ncbi:MAG TPA: sigma-70 family RNA polymerase sigma factor [Acidimicrobiia bacterium]|nr:sigma-70 family RNA polymerase sigma factor [Acidimicrobiia bacterium]